MTLVKTIQLPRSVHLRNIFYLKNESLPRILMTKQGNKKKKSDNKNNSSSNIGSGKNRVAVEIKDLKFEPAEPAVSNTSNSNDLPKSNTPNAANKLEKILNELENGYFAEVSKEENGPIGVESVGYLKKKMAALGFQAGIQLSGGGAFRDARKLLDGFPGDDDYELTFETVESTEEDDEADSDDSDDSADSDLDVLADLADKNIFLGGLDPLRILSSKIEGKNSDSSKKTGTLNYPLIDPLKLQVIQSAETELTTVHDLFESTTISANQKLPLLKRKYMELMQQDIRHRLEALRVRDYLDTLHLERQVVERELEKAINLRSSMEQLCERLQVENSKIRAEKAGITSKIYGDLELKALEEDDEKFLGKNGKKTLKKQKNPKNNNNNSNNTSTSSNSTANNIFNLPEAVKNVTFEIPDANKLLEGAQGDLRDRVKLLIDLYNQRETQFVSVLKAKDAEIQLLQVHYYSHQSQIQKMSQGNRELNNKVLDLSSAESDLRSQLSVYVDKFKQVEDTLSKSNDLFATFRHEMEQMTSKLGKLEKENSAYQAKCATLSRNIIEMADERSKQASVIEMLKNQKGKLESLCRSMQAERNAALQSKTVLN